MSDISASRPPLAPLSVAATSAVPTSTKGATTGTGKTKTIEDIYQKKTQLEHILLRPDSYIGSIQKYTSPMYIWDQVTSKIVSQTITYVPGLYKIFDEILVNAADNKRRDASMNKLKVVIDPSTNTLSVWNNGMKIRFLKVFFVVVIVSVFFFCFCI